MFKKYSMKTSKMALLLIVVLLMVSMAGCTKKADEAINNTPEQVEQAQQDESTTRVIKDMAGREVEIPKEINKVFTTSGVGTIALYSINPSKMAGLNSKLTALEEKYLTKEYQQLPILGSYKDASSGNAEEILKAKPDIIISMGNIDERWIKDADESQEKLGIPFLMIDGDLENLHKTYEFLGDILGEEERCKKLSEYCKNTIEEVKTIASTIPMEERIKVYYGTTQGPLVTNVTGSIHTQAIDLVGAINAAEVTVEKMSGGVEVSMEQVLNWNPDKIIAAKGMEGNEGSYEIITKDSKWKDIKAVQNNQVYAIPNAPFNWFDRPPSVNRVIGVKWLGNLIYPERFNYDMNKETKDFYEMFYHRALTDDEVAEILENAMPR
ncbi:ABC transporter substrate-binding protein [Alkaliphilus oremlandii]|uniref:Periplasmic binding protein n=1 Tax=Alkaliphilus oremlandii (strain OhILAs) TaxID=350688 RepID=A8MKW7_ALKOO|nr:ABC transporter substrate-binding protein [Alkaliphilus oremlandii]ABW17784.1 periplasmic binding protein [Alkaliphilus oremlandii OhILAs]